MAELGHTCLLATRLVLHSAWKWQDLQKRVETMLC